MLKKVKSYLRPKFPHWIFVKGFIPANELMPLDDHAVTLEMARLATAILARSRFMMWLPALFLTGPVSQRTHAYLHREMMKAHKRFKVSCGASDKLLRGIIDHLGSEVVDVVIVIYYEVIKQTSGEEKSFKSLILDLMKGNSRVVSQLLTCLNVVSVLHNQELQRLAVRYRKATLTGQPRERHNFKVSICEKTAELIQQIDFLDRYQKEAFVDIIYNSLS